MAIYHKCLQYHNDTIEKRDLTKEELKFLIELQKEMNTQDHVSQADPRFWVVKGSEKVYVGLENAEHLVLTDKYEGNDFAEGYEEIVKYLNEEVMPEISKNEGEEISLTYDSSLDYFIIKREIDENEDFSGLWKDIHDLEDYLSEKGFDYLTFAGYRISPKIYSNTLALTQKAMEDHLRANYYHYSEDAHTYAMTAWRNPEADKLWKILHEANFEKMLKNYQKKLDNQSEIYSENDGCLLNNNNVLYELKIYADWKDEVDRYVFNNLEKAQDFMREKWQEAVNSNEYDVKYHNESFRCDEHIVQPETYFEDNYAVVTWTNPESNLGEQLRLRIEKVNNMLD